MTLDIEGASAKMTREIEGGKEIIEANLPLVLVCQEPIAEWKIPNMRCIMTARSKPLTVIEPTDNSVRTQTESFEIPPKKGQITIIDADNVDELINLLKNEAKVI